MKLLQTIASMNATGGGTSSCTYQLFNALYNLDPEVRLLSMAPKSSGTEVLGNGSQWLVNLPNDYRTPLGISKNIRNYLKNSDAEIFHTNGMWMDVNHATCAIARSKGRPYVVSPHGMLYSKALKRSRWKKVPLEILWFKNDIFNASCISVTCEEEMQQVREYGYSGPIAIIGNPVEIPPHIDDINKLCDTEFHYHNHTIGFLGRLHPIKQVELILYGLSISKFKHNIRVVIIGEGDAAYTDFLHKEAERLGLTNQVEFKGFINGREKFEQLSRMSALFVPSDMENFGMIIPEALLVNTPVMASLGTPWEALNTHGCGWWTEASPESISNVIDKIMQMSPSDLKSMGKLGAQYVRDNFAAPVIASRMMELYRWLLGERPKPDFVMA